MNAVLQPAHVPWTPGGERLSRGGKWRCCCLSCGPVGRQNADIPAKEPLSALERDGQGFAVRGVRRAFEDQRAHIAENAVDLGRVPQLVYRNEAVLQIRRVAHSLEPEAELAVAMIVY